MSVLGTISLSGLSESSSDFVLAGTLEITSLLRMDPGSTLLLQPNSVSDSALSSNVAFLNATQSFDNVNTFKALVEANAGLTSIGVLRINRAPGDISIIMQDTTSLNTNILSINGTTASYSMTGSNSGHSFFVRTAIGATSNVLSLTNAQVTVTSTNMINTTATDAAVTDNTGKLATTRWVTSKQTNFLTLANTWTNQNTFSRAAGLTNIRLLDSTNSTQFTGSVGNNQVNFIMSNNDSKIYFNTNTPAGVQTNTLLINSTTTILTTTNPLVQTATMPPSSDSSTYTPTTAWVQGVLTFNIASLLNANNTWGGTNNFNLQLNANGGIVLNLPSGQSAIQIIDATSLNSNTLSVNGVAARYIQNGVSSVHNFFVRDSLNVQATAASFSKALVTFNSDIISWSGTDPAVTDATAKLATTRFVNSKQTDFLTLNNTWTGSNQFNNQVTCQRSGIDMALKITSTTQTNYQGNMFISNGAGNYNGIVQANEFVIFGSNSAALDLGTLTLTTHSTTSSGIKITNNLTKVFGANEFDTKIKTSRTSTPSAQCLGDIYKVQCVSGIITNFFLSTWNGTTNISLYSYTFDDSTDNKRFGTYLVKVALNYENSVATTALCCNVNTINATDNLSANMQTVGTGNTMLVGGNFQYNINFSFVEQVYSTKTFYMNVTRTTSGVGGFTNTSYISWTRIA